VGDSQLRQDRLAGRAVSTRLAVWSITTLVCLLFALTHREAAPAPPPAPLLPTAIYGDALPATSAFGADAVCTEYELGHGGGWRCDSALVNSSHVPVYPAARYAGPCAHLKVVERSWVCLGNTPAPEPEPAAPSVSA
jgi:hypothetical protein